MLQPVNLQLAHFNVEHSAQISRDSLAASLQTGQGQEIVKENVKRAQIVEASIAASEPRKVKRRDEDERERRREQQQAFSSNSDSSEENQPEPETASEAGRDNKSQLTKSFDLYA